MGWVDTVGWHDTNWSMFRILFFFDFIAMDFKQKTKTNIIGIDSYNDFWYPEHEKIRAWSQIFWNRETRKIEFSKSLKKCPIWKKICAVWRTLNWCIWKSVSWNFIKKEKKEIFSEIGIEKSFWNLWGELIHFPAKKRGGAKI